MKITLDPGHGQFGNPGVLSGYYEGTRVFMLAEQLRKELEKYEDTEVVLTRKNITDNPSLANRGGEAAKNGSRLFLSLHTNAASNPAAHGVSVFRSINRPQSEELGRLLGNCVVGVMKKHTDITYLRGVMTRTESFGGELQDYYGVIRSSVKSDNVEYSFIIEHGFHTNLTECGYMYDDASLCEIACAEAKVIADYFGLKLKGGEKPDHPGYIEYIVKSGDTLTSIARRYGTTWRVLAEYNALKDPDLIIDGQIIRIPVAYDFAVGDTVRIKEDKDTYFPGGKPFSRWVHDYDYAVGRIADSKGRDVYRNGDRCVLLGSKINRRTGAHGSPINSWTSVEYIEKIYGEKK